MNWNKERVNIIYASNDGYACHLAASLVSLMENNRQIPHLDVYVLSVGMCGEYQERLKAIAAGYGRQLWTIELGNLRERFDYDIDTRGFDISAMARLFAPQVLPDAVEKALYLDCDTIVCRIDLIHVIFLNTGTFSAAVSAETASTAMNLHSAQKKFRHRVARTFRTFCKGLYER